VPPMQASSARRITRSAGSSSMAAVASVATVFGLVTSDPASPPDSTEPDSEPRATTTHASYPIGWIHRHPRRLPAADAGWSARAMMSSLSTTARKRPTDVESGWNPAATLPPRRDPHRPCQTRNSGYLRNAERADWFRIATRLALDVTPWKPRRASLAPATSCVSMLKTPNPGVDSRCLERVATLAAEQHAHHSTTEPSWLDCRAREPKLTLPTLLLSPAASTQAPTPPAAFAAAD
jgi:hypothetical protein